MAFPSAAAPTTTSFATLTTAHAVNMPATVNAGDLLVVQLHVKGASTIPAITTPVDWTLKDTDTSSGAFDTRVSIYVKSAAGTEGGGTVDFVTDVTARGSALAHRVTGWAGSLSDVTLSAVVFQGSTTAPNPPSLTPPGGAQDFLWLALAHSYDDDANFTGFPASYTNTAEVYTGAGSNNSTACASANRQLNAATEDPGTFTLASNEGVFSWTMAVASVAIAGAIMNQLQSGNLGADLYNGTIQ